MVKVTKHRQSAAKRQYKARSSPRQIRAAEIISANRGESLKAMLLEAGYSEAVSDSPDSNVISRAGYLNALKNIEPVLRSRRNLVLHAIDQDSVAKASLRDKAITLDILQKHHSAITGTTKSGDADNLKTLILQQINVFRSNTTNFDDTDNNIT